MNFWAELIMAVALLTTEALAADPKKRHAEIAVKQAVELSSKASQNATATVAGLPVQCESGDPAVDGGEKDHAGEYSDDFCKDPYAAVCGEGLVDGEDPPARVAREQALTARIGQFSQAALEKTRLALVTLGKWPKERTNFSQDNLDGVLKNLDIKEKAIVQTGLLFNYWANWDNPLGKLERQFVAKAPKMRQYLDAAVRRNIRVEKRASQIIAEFEKVEVVTSYEINERFKDRKDVLDQFSDSYSRICGTLGLSDNAFAKTTLDGKMYFMLCPGFLLRAEQGIDPTDEDAAIEQNIVATLGHELSHHIDMKSAFAADHRELLSCLDQNYNSLKENGRPIFDDTHHSETLCDHWGANTLFEYLLAKEAEFGRQLSKKEKLEALRRANAITCNKELVPFSLGLGQSSLDIPDPHPPGRFRIEAILRSNPDLAPLMGCSFPEGQSADPKAPVACGVNGKKFPHARKNQPAPDSDLVR